MALDIDQHSAERQVRLAHAFEQHRPYLRAVAYRMLGSVSDAEDALQDAWLRLSRAAPDDEQHLRPWLTTVVSRRCLDLLRSRRARREDYAGSWLPEPIAISEEPTPEAVAEMADMVGLALLVVLETLSPAERLAFVLHDVFGCPLEEIAAILGRSAAATRQLASRARRRIKAAGPSPDADLAVGRRVVDAFLRAAREGDFEALLSMLDPDVVLLTDGGGQGSLARPPAVGAAAVIGVLRARSGSFAPLGRPATINGGPGVIVRHESRVLAAVSFTVVGGRIRQLLIVGDPHKLGHVPG